MEILKIKAAFLYVKICYLYRYESVQQLLQSFLPGSGLGAGLSFSKLQY